MSFSFFFFYDRHWEKIITRFSNIASNQINLIKSEYNKAGFDKAREIANKLNIDFKVIKKKQIIKEKNNFFKKKLKLI